MATADASPNSGPPKLAPVPAPRFAPATTPATATAANNTIEHGRDVWPPAASPYNTPRHDQAPAPGTPASEHASTRNSELQSSSMFQARPPSGYPSLSPPHAPGHQGPPHPSAMHHHGQQQQQQQQQQHAHPHHPPSGTAPTSSESSWFQNLQPSTSITDGEQFVHLPAPFLNGAGPTQAAPANNTASNNNQPNGSADTLQGTSPQISTKSGPARSRKKDKLRDDPQRLEDLRDPIPGSKPDYPYPVLIKCAILSHSKRSPTLSEIYEMIHGRFGFFKMDDASWKNSVRHYLSISPSFEKIPRPITEPGKGNYWTFNPNPTEKTRRKSSRKAQKPKPEDEPMHDANIAGIHNTNGARLPPPPPLHTPSSSGDGINLARDRGIASRQRSPAHQWLEARDHMSSLAPGGPRSLHRDSVQHRENLPSPEAFLKEPRVPVGGPPPSSYANGGPNDEYHQGLPQSPYAPSSSPGIRSAGNGAPVAGPGQGGNASDYMYAQSREQSYSRPTSAYTSTSTTSLPSLGDSIFRGGDAPRGPPPPSRHVDDRSRPPMTSSNGSYAPPPSSYAHAGRSPYEPKREVTEPTPGHLYRQPELTSAYAAHSGQGSNW